MSDEERVDYGALNSDVPDETHEEYMKDDFKNSWESYKEHLGFTFECMIKVMWHVYLRTNKDEDRHFARTLMATYNRAVCELSNGLKDGPHLRFLRSMLRYVDEWFYIRDLNDYGIDLGTATKLVELYIPEPKED